MSGAVGTTVAERPRSAPDRRTRLWSSNPAVVLWGTLVGFVIGHMLGT